MHGHIIDSKTIQFFGAINELTNLKKFFDEKSRNPKSPHKYVSGQISDTLTVTGPTWQLIASALFIYRVPIKDKRSDEHEDEHPSPSCKN
jgi:hypothetical protein